MATIWGTCCGASRVLERSSKQVEHGTDFENAASSDHAERETFAQGELEARRVGEVYVVHELLKALGPQDVDQRFFEPRWQILCLGFEQVHGCRLPTFGAWCLVVRRQEAELVGLNILVNNFGVCFNCNCGFYILKLCYEVLTHPARYCH